MSEGLLLTLIVMVVALAGLVLGSQLVAMVLDQAGGAL